jgi:hypothetical protein
MQQASFKSVAERSIKEELQLSALSSALPQLELKSLWTFLAIKHCQRTKNRKVIKQSRSLLKMMAHMCAISG